MVDVFCQREMWKEYNIFETENFYVKIGKGIITPGHVMLITKDHYDCFAEIPEELEQEFFEIKKYLIKKITETFSKPFLQEAGIWGQTVPHAHIHFIPTKTENYQVNSIIEEMVKPSGAELEIIDWKKLKEIYKKERGYITIEEDGKTYVFHTDDVTKKPPHHLIYRYFFADKFNLKGTRSWQNMTEEDKKLDLVKINTTQKLLKL